MSAFLGQEKPIVGGTLAEAHEFPYAVYLRIETTPGKHAVCGGTLVSSQHVVTAGHCVHSIRNAERIKVGYGSSRLKDQMFQLAKAFQVHPNFNPSTLENDIAIITLNEPIQESNFAHRIPVYFGHIEEGQIVTAMGWGLTSNVPGSHTVSIMNKVDLLIANATECNRVDPMFTSNNGPFFCTGTQPGDRDECNGDSGAPAVVYLANGVPRRIGWNEDGEPIEPHEYVRKSHKQSSLNGVFLVGLTSYGDNLRHDTHPPCGDPSGFGYSTHIGYYGDFLMQVTGMSMRQLQSQVSFNERIAKRDLVDSAASGRGMSIAVLVFVLVMVCRFIQR